MRTNQFFCLCVSILFITSSLNFISFYIFTNVKTTDKESNVKQDVMHQEYWWMDKLPPTMVAVLVNKISGHCGKYLTTPTEIYSATNAFVGTIPLPKDSVIPANHRGPWAPKSNYDPKSPHVRVLFLSDISTYTRFAVRQYWHYFYAASADHRVFARLWGYGFPGFDMKKSVVENLKAYYNGDTTLMQ